MGARGCRLQFETQPGFDPMGRVKLMQGQPRVFAMEGPDTLKLKLEPPDAGSGLRTARDLPRALAGNAA